MPNTGSAAGVPAAPTVDKYYEFLGGGKPKAGGEVEKDELGDLLDAADVDLEFKPDGMEFASAGEPAKPKAPPEKSMAQQL